jgi:hypothetical protein
MTVVRDWIGKRDSRVASTLLKKLTVEDVNEYKICLQMTPKKFDALLDTVVPKIERQNTQMRNAISPSVMLEVTLCFMATGNCYRTLQYFFKFQRRLFLTVYQKYAMQFMTSSGNSKK